MARKTTIAVKTLMDNAGLRDGAQEAEGIMSGLGGKATAGLAVAGAAGAAALIKGFGDALNQNALEAKFGDTAVAGAAEIYRDAWGDSLEDVATQWAETQRAFGDVSNLDQLTESAFIIAEAFDRDVNSSMQDAKELTESFGIDGAEAFDLLAVAMAGSTADVRDELSSAIREYGDFFDGLGFSADETLALLGEFGEGGAMQLDKAADALKELTIRGTDMSTASVAAFEAAGLSAEDMTAKLLAGGADGQDAMREIAAGLLSIKDPAERANAAIALFGAPLEDLGVSQIPEFLGQIQNMGAGLGDTEGAAAALGDQLSDSLGARLESLKREGFGALADTLNEHVVPAMIVMFDWVEEHWPEIQATIAEAMEHVRVVIQSVIDIVTVIWERWGAEITEFVTETWEGIQKQIEGALDIIEGVFRAFSALFRGDWEELWDALGQILDGAWEVIVGSAERLWAQVKLAASIAWDLLKNEVRTLVTDTIPGLFLKAHTLLWRAGFDLLMKAKDGIGTAIGNALDAVTGFVTGLPGLFRDWGVYLYDGAWSFFHQIVDAAEDALTKLPGIIADKVLGPLDELLAKVTGIDALDFNSGGGSGNTVYPDGRGGVSRTPPEEVFGDPDQIAKAVAGGANPAFYHYHLGGMVVPDWTTGNLVGNDEAMIVAQVGETITQPGAAGGGPLVGTLIVNDQRSIAEELELAWLMHGGRWN